MTTKKAIGNCALEVLKHKVREKIIKMPYANVHKTLQAIELYQRNNHEKVSFSRFKISAFWRDVFGKALLEHTSPAMTTSKKEKREISLMILDYWLLR